MNNTNNNSNINDNNFNKNNTINVFTTFERPFNVLSNNYPFTMTINSKDYNTVTNYIYSNLLLTPIDKLILQNASVINIDKIFNELKNKSTEQTIFSSLEIAYAEKLKNPDLKNLLLSTNNSHIVYINDNDPILGFNQKTKKGLNAVGKILQQFRQRFQSEKIQENETKEQKDFNNKLIKAYIVNTVLKKALYEGYDITQYYNKSLDDILSTFNYMISSVDTENVILLYKNNQLSNYIVRSVNNPNNIIDVLRKDNLRNVGVENSLAKKYIVFDMYLDYMLRKNFTELDKKQYYLAKQQQLSTISNEKKANLVLRVYELYKQGYLSANLSNDIDKRFENMYKPSEAEIIKAENKYIDIINSKSIITPSIYTRKPNANLILDPITQQYMQNKYIHTNSKFVVEPDETDNKKNNKRQMVIRKKKRNNDIDLLLAEDFEEKYDKNQYGDGNTSNEKKDDGGAEPDVIFMYSNTNNGVLQLLSVDRFTSLMQLNEGFFPTIMHYVLYRLFLLIPNIKTAHNFLLKNINESTSNPNNYISIHELYEKYITVSKQYNINNRIQYAKIALDKKFTDLNMQIILLMTGDKRINFVSKNKNSVNNQNNININVIETYTSEYLETIRDYITLVDNISINNIDLLFKDPFMANWLYTKIKDTCRVINTMKNYLDLPFITETFTNVVLELFFQPCSSIIKNAGNVGLAPLYFKVLVESCNGFNIDFKTKTKREQGFFIQQNDKILQILWSQIMSTIAYLIRKEHISTLDDIKNRLTQAQAEVVSTQSLENKLDMTQIVIDLALKIKQFSKEELMLEQIPLAKEGDYDYDQQRMNDAYWASEAVDNDYGEPRKNDNFLEEGAELNDEVEGDNIHNIQDEDDDEKEFEDRDDALGEFDEADVDYGFGRERRVSKNRKNISYHFSIDSIKSNYNQLMQKKRLVTALLGNLQNIKIEDGAKLLSFFKDITDVQNMFTTDNAMKMFIAYVSNINMSDIVNVFKQIMQLPSVQQFINNNGSIKYMINLISSIDPRVISMAISLIKELMNNVSFSYRTKKKKIIPTKRVNALLQDALLQSTNSLLQSTKSLLQGASSVNSSIPDATPSSPVEIASSLMSNMQVTDIQSLLDNVLTLPGVGDILDKNPDVKQFVTLLTSVTPDDIAKLVSIIKELSDVKQLLTSKTINNIVSAINPKDVTTIINFLQNIPMVRNFLDSNTFLKNIVMSLNEQDITNGLQIIKEISNPNFSFCSSCGENEKSIDYLPKYSFRDLGLGEIEEACLILTPMGILSEIENIISSEEVYVDVQPEIYQSVKKSLEMNDVDITNENMVVKLAQVITMFMELDDNMYKILKSRLLFFKVN